jgi:hypothetical protein
MPGAITQADKASGTMHTLAPRTALRSSSLIHLLVIFPHTRITTAFVPAQNSRQIYESPPSGSRQYPNRFRHPLISFFNTRHSLRASTPTTFSAKMQ